LDKGANLRRIVFTNDKGGVGKTTTVANLAVGLAKKGVKTLVIDMDPQADATFTLLTERPPEASGGYIPPTIHSLLIGQYSMQQAILPVPRYSNLSLVPANSDLADASLRLARHPTRLRRLLLDLPGDTCDVVLIDTGKGLDPLAINALAAADEVIVMLSPGRLELDAIARMQ
jgi:chromosome partitioning protein